MVPTGRRCSVLEGVQTADACFVAGGVCCLQVVLEHVCVCCGPWHRAWASGSTLANVSAQTTFCTFDDAEVVLQLHCRRGIRDTRACEEARQVARVLGQLQPSSRYEA